MRLTLVLNKFHRAFIGAIPKHRGNVLTGRKRFVPPVTMGQKLGLLQELKYEEEVMKFLSKSYITEFQEAQYLESVGKSHPEYWDDFTRRPIEKPLKQYYAADFLQPLNISRSFDEEN